MKLYFSPLSGNSRRVLLVSTHLDVPLEKIVIDLPKGEQKADAHIARNPNGRVPVLDDDGFVLWESRAIMQYLCDKTPGQTLWPTEMKARADVSRWLFWCANHMQPTASILVQERFVKKFRGAPIDPVEEARGEAQMKIYCPVLDDALKGKTWLAQDRLTLADYSVAASFALAGPARFALEPYANLRAWLGRVQETDAWMKTAPPPARP
jgi:glutathione S-transferase